jgi:hypothetical protein
MAAGMAGDPGRTRIDTTENHSTPPKPDHPATSFHELEGEFPV